MKLLSIIGVLLISQSCLANGHSIGPQLMTTPTKVCHSGTTLVECYTRVTPIEIKAHQRYIEREIAWYAPEPEESWWEDYFYTDGIPTDQWISHTILCLLTTTLFLLGGIVILSLFVFCCYMVFMLLAIVYSIIACILNIFLPARWVLPVPELDFETSNTKTECSNDGPGFFTGLVLGGLFF